MVDCGQGKRSAPPCARISGRRGRGSEKRIDFSERWRFSKIVYILRERSIGVVRMYREGPSDIARLGRIRGALGEFGRLDVLVRNRASERLQEGHNGGDFAVGQLLAELVLRHLLDG